MLAVPGLNALARRQALGENHCKKSALEAAGGPDHRGFRLGEGLCRRSSLACHERSCDCREFPMKTWRRTPRVGGRGRTQVPYRGRRMQRTSGTSCRAGRCRSFQAGVHVAPYPGGEDLAACHLACRHTHSHCLERKYSASTCPESVLAIPIRSGRFSRPDPSQQAVPVLNIHRIGRSFQPCPGSTLYQVYSMIPADRWRNQMRVSSMAVAIATGLLVMLTVQANAAC